MPKYYTSEGAVTAGSMEEALVWAAYIQDHTGEFFNRFDNNVNRLAKDTDQAMGKMKAGSKESAAGMGILAGAIGGITMKLASMGLQAVQQFKQVITSSIQVAARANTLAISLGVVGTNAGYSAEQLAKFEKEMKAGGITTIKSREALMKMAQANLDLGQAADLARVAQDAAVIAGTNSSEAFGRMLHGITTLNPRVLRHLGIVVNMQQEYKKYAATMDIAVSEIDYAVKQQIMMNAVFTAGARIAGTYEAAMGTAGKQANSMARLHEELQLAMGEAFQPAYLEWIQFQTQLLKEALEWFAANKEEVTEFATELGTLMGILFKVAKVLMKVITFLSPLVQGLKGASSSLKGLQEAFGIDLWTTFKQTLALVAAGLSAVFAGMKQTAKAIWGVFTAIDNLKRLLLTPIWERDDEWRQQWDDAKQSLSEVGDEFGKVRDAATGAAVSTFDTFANMLGLIEPAAKDAAGGLDELEDAVDHLALEMEGMIPILEELNAKFEKEMAEIAIRRARDAIEAEIRLARQIEDLVRSHKERVEDILKDAENRRRDLIEDANDEQQALIEEQAQARDDLERSHLQTLLDIEVNYRRRLEQIQEDFDYQSSELARRNDAVALARLMRQTARQLSEAEKARDTNHKDAQSRYVEEQQELKRHQEQQRKEIEKDLKERMDDYKADLQERLQEAAEQREEDYENLQRNLQRQREDQQRHYQQEDEDRARAHKDELEKLGTHFSEMEYMTEDHVGYMLDTYGAAIEGLDAMWDAYYRRRESVAIAAGAYTRTDIPISGAAAVGASAGDIAGASEYMREWMGLAHGGMGVVHGPTDVSLGEEGPEAFAAIPLNRVTQHDYNFHFDDWNITGVSSQTEADLKPMMMQMLTELAQGLREGRGR